MPASSSSTLAVEHVTRQFDGHRALNAVSLEIAAGECLALVGESGSGKTTLLRTLNALEIPDEGRVLVGGVDVRSLNAVSLRRGMGYVQQDGGLLPHWTVARNAGMVPWLLGRPDAASAGEAALRLVGLPAADFGQRYPSALSGGQRQRVAIARAIAAHPAILLMDEPFGALDAITRAELQRAFLGWRADLGTTVVLVTHDLREAFLLADRVAVLRAGRLEQVAEPDTLRRTPASDYVARLLETAGVA